jgi:putative spermidine/putrescine transport system permease protein
MKTANRLPGQESGDWRTIIEGIDKRWQDPRYWTVLKHETGRLTPSFLLAAIDLRRAAEGGVERVEEGRRLYLQLLLSTFEISFWVALICLLLGYPTAYVLTRLSLFAAGTGDVLHHAAGQWPGEFPLAACAIDQ